MKRALTLFLTIALAISLFAGFGTAGAEEEYL